MLPMNGAFDFIMNNEELNLLKAALSEIESLRSQNKMMAARLGVYDDMMALLKTSPVSSFPGLMHPDIAYDIRKQIVKSESEIKEADGAKAKQRND